MLGQAAQATISYLKLPQGNSCFPDEVYTRRVVMGLGLIIYLVGLSPE